MKSLLTLTAFVEAITGLALIAVPDLVLSLLLGVSLLEPSGILLSKLSGIALVSLAIACWQARDNTQASIVITKAFVFYNSSAALLLLYASLIEHLSGIGLWPAVLLHIALLVWCASSLLKRVR
jgi:hypothetical protein